MTYLTNQPVLNPKCCQKVAGGRSVAQTPGTDLCDPFRVQIQLPSDPGVSLRSTPGYCLAALRAASVLSRNVICPISECDCLISECDCLIRQVCHRPK